MNKEKEKKKQKKKTTTIKQNKTRNKIRYNGISVWTTS
jgi:hypothetical protein